jgi:hypothetical protein
LSSVIWFPKNEEVGQKTKVVGQKNPKLQEWEIQEVIPLWRVWVGSRIDDKQECFFILGFVAF